MSTSKRTVVIVLYNFVGVDEYAVLRQKVREGSVISPTGRQEDLENIATLHEEIQAIVDALQEEGFDCRAVNIQDDFNRLLKALTSPRPDVCFNLVEFFNDNALLEDRVAGLFDLLDMPYTGSPPLTLALCQRKGLAKQILKANNIPTPRSKLVPAEPIPSLRGLRYPLIVKPSWEDASAGVTEQSVVEERTQLERQVRLVWEKFQQPALIEEFIEGRELGVSIIGNKPPRMLPVEEMDFSDLPPERRRIISFESKWDPLQEDFYKGTLVCPAKLSRAVLRRVKAVSLRTYQIMGCRDYSRIDLRLDHQNRLFVLEVNPNPDLTAGVAFMASAEAGGLTFSGTLRFIVEEALARRRTVEPAGGGADKEPLSSP
jgi:D-alanine-D-alanine ligase